MDGVADIGIGRRVRAARERASLSREALAVDSGVSWSAIAQIESGRRTNLRPGTLAALARTLGTSVDYLVSGPTSSTPPLDHLALLYETDTAFYAAAVPFLFTAVERGEAVIAVTSRGKIAGLRRQLGPAARLVTFAEQHAWYKTPVAALQGYRDFLDRAVAGGAPWVRALGEPVFGASPSAARPWARYESLLNLAFAGSPATILCPYDATKLKPSVAAQIRATHPYALEGEKAQPVKHFADPARYILT